MLLKKGLRAVTQISVRFISKDVRKSLNPNLCKYFLDIGFTTNEIKQLSSKNHQMKFVSPDNVEDLFKLLEGYDVDRRTVFFCHPNLLHRKSSAIRLYARVLDECGLDQVKPQYLISYFRIMKSKSVEELKKESIIPEDLDVYHHICSNLCGWTHLYYQQPTSYHHCTLFNIRLQVLKKYLKWRLDMNEERFADVIKTYNRFYHRTLRDMERSIDIAEQIFGMTTEKIVRNPFVIAADPENTMNIIHRVQYLHGVCAKEAININTLIIKEDYRHLMQVNEILKEQGITLDCKHRIVKMFVLKPKELIRRLEQIRSTPELNIFINNKRLPKIVEYEKSVVSRLSELKKENIKCPSINLLTCFRKNFDVKIQKFGDRYAASDVVYTILGNLSPENSTSTIDELSLKEAMSRHGYYKNVPLSVVIQTIDQLKTAFTTDEILNNCQLLLYSSEIIKEHLQYIMQLKQRQSSYNLSDSTTDDDEASNSNDNSSIDKSGYLSELRNVDLISVTNNQLLGLILYLVERKYNFTDNGVWNYEVNDS